MTRSAGYAEFVVLLEIRGDGQIIRAHVVMRRLLVESLQAIREGTDVRHVLHEARYVAVFLVPVPYHRVNVDVTRFRAHALSRFR